MSELDPSVRRYYDHGLERDRLTTDGSGLLELERTRDILRRFLPPSGRVLDVGGGAGVHATWLRSLGYDVELFDPVPLHVEQAREAGLAAEQADARSVPRPDGCADAVLLLGPLYHLTERADRVLALREAKRVVRPGGVVVAAAISRFASLTNGLAREFLADPVFARIVEDDLATGQHRNPTGTPGYFTTSFFHSPGELAEEVIDAGFAAVRLLAVEGFACLLGDLDARMADPDRAARVLDALRRIEEEPALMGATAHILAVGR